jgi:resuscitation-promoting factor RpfB
LIDLLLLLIPPGDQIQLLPHTWKELARCESSLNPEALNPSGKYRGLFQFDLRSWEYVGGTGNPEDTPVHEQYKRAKMLQDKQGWEAWPQCARQIGVIK